MGKENAMIYLQALLVAAGLFTFAAGNAQAGSIKIIANLSVKSDTISTDELKSVFLGEQSSLNDGSHVEPVLEKGGATHEAFVKEYLGKSDSALQIYYRSLVFTGKGSMPKAVGFDADVVAYVAKTKGAIGYVASGARAEGVKTLEVK
jgi:ABC-type phosphate transport system substrate-binding protein